MVKIEVMDKYEILSSTFSYEKNSYQTLPYRRADTIISGILILPTKHCHIDASLVKGMISFRVQVILVTPCNLNRKM